MARRSRVAVLLIAAVSVLPACSAGPSSRPEIIVNEAPGQQSTPPAATSEVPQLEKADSDIQWRECSAEIRSHLSKLQLPGWLPIDCGRINGVLDSPYAPGRGTARLQLLRAGKGPVPVVVVNDVDGLPGTVYAARLAATLPQEFFDEFSLIGMDRRGTGNSGAANCVPLEVRRSIIEPDPSQLDVSGWLESAQTAGQQCSIALESQLPALDTWRTAADLDTLRDALGINRLNAVGHGEGSRVISVFADRFPERVGRLVLDGLPDPTQDAAIALEGVAKGGEAAFDAFAADCVNRGCELGNDPEQALTDLLGQVRDAPMPVGEVSITPGAVLHAMLIGLSDRATWPTLSAALATARAGDPTGLSNLLAPTVIGSNEQSATLDGTLVISCNDTRTRLTPAQLEKAADDWHDQFPLFGALAAQRLALCSSWTVPNKPLPTPTGRGAPPVLVLGTASDAVTPLEGTERAAQQLDSGVLVSWQGGGHGALSFSPCATTIAVNFLTNAAVPRNGTVCPP